MRSTKYLITAALISLAPHALATEEASGVTLSPGIGLSMFDDDRNVKNGNHLNLGLGYRFDSPWAVELNYTDIDTDSELTNTSSDGRQWRLDSLYNLDVGSSNIKPFLSFGAGRLKLDNNGVSTDNETQLNVGAGVKYLFSSNSALRADMKLFRGTSDTALDSGITVGYQYTFGDTGRSVPLLAAAPVLDLDADDDGVKDSTDRCSNTPIGTSVDRNGCDDDTDQDGVKNAQDKCLQTPAGVTVDASGCGMDSDRDGVADHRDVCPQTYPPALVDETGCYTILEEAVSITLDVEFDFDSAKSRPAHSVEVKKVANFMRQYPLTAVTFEGHTDSMGAADYNQRLSEQRAASIAKLLIEEFKVDASRVRSFGYGEAKPVATNDDKAGRQSNRRVVAVVAAVNKTDDN
ncbi:MAG: OOP family OmpA-OmpF porin [Candidatus Azotimanducaceae bacterium]|jgi:OOP family OmpA-OmpF porin